MGIKEFLQDEGSVRLGLWLGRHLSLGRGLRIAGWLGKRVAAGKHRPMVRNIKVNQWVVSGGGLNRVELDSQASAVVQRLAKAQFEYFYYYQHPEQGMKNIVLSPRMQEMVEETVVRKVPTFILGPHVGNFDLFGLMLTWIGIKAFVLSYPTPNNAYKAQNALRQKVDLHMAPITFQAFREAKQVLREGGCVITGIDRVIENEDAKYRPKFFGRPASLPLFYTRLILETGAKGRVGCGLQLPDGRYYLDCSDPISFQKLENPSEEYILNVEKTMREAETFILKNPEQWAMFHPVWPEAAAEIQHLL